MKKRQDNRNNNNNNNRKYPYPPQERSLEIPRGRGSQKPKHLKKSMKLNWKFQGEWVGGGGSNQKKPSMWGAGGKNQKNPPMGGGGGWIFSGITHCHFIMYLSIFSLRLSETSRV